MNIDDNISNDSAKNFLYKKAILPIVTDFTVA